MGSGKSKEASYKTLIGTTQHRLISQETGLGTVSSPYSGRRFPDVADTK
jgi:hypothetical protein